MPNFGPIGLQIWLPCSHLGKQTKLRAITPEVMAGSAPNFNHRYIYLVRVFYRMPSWVSTQEVSTMPLAISFLA
jgi:hypothetical protein